MKNQKRIIAVVLSILLILGSIHYDTYAATSQKTSKISITNVPAKILVVKKGKSYKLKTKVIINGKTSKKASKKISYKSSNKKVVKVNSKGVVKGLKKGKTKLTVKCTVNPKVKKTITVKVGSPIKRLSAKQKNVGLSVGEKHKIKMTISPVKATYRTLSYKSSNKKVASVSKKGIVKALKPGKATITVKSMDGSNKKAKVVITVSAKQIGGATDDKTTEDKTSDDSTVDSSEATTVENPSGDSTADVDSTTEEATVTPFDVPYVATYYFNPKPLTTDNIQIPLYITDNEQSEYLKKDTKKTLDLIYEVDGVSKTIENIPLGDYTLTIGRLSEGNHTFAVQTYDKQTKLKSHKLYNDLWVVKSNVISNAETYRMTEKDLTDYKINRNGSASPADLENTRDGLNKLFQDKSEAGFKKIVLLEGTYRINGEDYNRNKSIKIPSHFTVDMNKSTFKLNPILTDIDFVTTQNKDTTPQAIGALVCFDKVVDAHLTNGTLVGDRVERVEKGLETDPANRSAMGEAINTVVMKGGKYCSVDNMRIINTTGHTVIKFYEWGDELYLEGYTRTAIFDGKEVPAEDCSTSSYTDLSKILARNESEKAKYMGENYMYVGHPQGYRGIYGKSAIVYVSFYDASKNYLETVTGYQYRKMAIPKNAQYARVTLLGTDFKTLSENRDGTVSIYGKHLGDYCEFKDIAFEDTRTCALAPANGNNMLIEGCTYKSCGHSITPAAVDFEDGAQECQDIYYQNNKVLEQAGTMTLIDNYGFNHLMINNENHTYEIRNRVVGGLITGINDKDGQNSTVLWKVGDKVHTPYGRIFGNNSGMISVTDIQRYENGQPVREPNPVDFIVKDCVIHGGMLNSAPKVVTYEECTFDKVNPASAKLVNCTMQVYGGSGGQIGSDLYCYGCTFKTMDGAATHVLPWSQAVDAVRVFEDCKFLGKTEPNKFLASATFKNCEFEDISISGWATDRSNKEKTIFEGCTINSSGSYFFEVGPYSQYTGYTNFTFKDCTITHTGRNLIQLTAKPTTGSQLVFDNCTINKSTGTLVTGFDSFNLAGATNIGYDITFKNTPVNSALTVDTSKINDAVIKIKHEK